MRGDEIEIARIVLASVTGDVISIRARRGGNRIRLSIVDEHESKYLLKPRSSAHPLSMGELVDLINTSAREEDAFSNGLAIGHVVWHIEGALVDDPDQMRSFVTVESAFYPCLKQFYASVIDEYLDGIVAARREEDEVE